MSNQVWFTSDIHFFHSRVIEFCNRPFISNDDMNEGLIKNWNEVVTKGDRVYILGDVSFGKIEETSEIIKRLNGNLYLIIGNHDKWLAKKKEFKDLFIWTKDIAEVTIDKQPIVMCHYPILSWHRMESEKSRSAGRKGSWMLHGHCHGNLDPKFGGKRLDVGVDCNGYRPINFDEVRIKMDDIEAENVDNH